MFRKTTALAVELAGDTPPKEIRLFKAGVNTTLKGDFLFDAAASKAVIEAYAAHKTDVAFDYAHAMIREGVRPQDQIAAGWCKLEVRNGELWAVDIKWTEAASAGIAAKEWRYCSPLFFWDATTNPRRILELRNIALTNVPATDDAAPLVAADHRSTALASGMSFEATIDTVRKGLSARFGFRYFYVKDIFDDRVIVVFEDNSEMISIPYRIESGVAMFEGEATKVTQTYVPVAPTATDSKRASAQDTCTMDKKILEVLSLQAEAQETEVLAAVTRHVGISKELCDLTGKKTPHEALGIVSGWQESARQLPDVQKQLSDLQVEGRRTKVEALLDGAPAKVTPATRKSLLDARKYDTDDDVAWLSSHIEALPEIQALKGIKTSESEVQSDPNPTAGKKYEELSFQQRADLKRKDPANFEALRAEHQARKSA